MEEELSLTLGFSLVAVSGLGTIKHVDPRETIPELCYFLFGRNFEVIL